MGKNSSKNFVCYEERPKTIQVPLNIFCFHEESNNFPVRFLHYKFDGLKNRHRNHIQTQLLTFLTDNKIGSVQLENAAEH